MKVDPRHFRVLRAIAEHGTFHRAGEALGMTQPAVSKALALLERSLDARLFERGKWGNVLTRAGQVALRSAEGVDRAVAHAQTELAAQRQNLDGPLRIGVVPSLAQGLLPRALGDHAGTMQTSIVSILVGSDRTLLDALNRGLIEMALSPVLTTSTPLRHIEEIPLAHEPYLLALPQGHPLLRRASVTIADVAGDRWLLPPARSRHGQTIEAMFLASGYAKPADFIETTDPNLDEALAMATRRLWILNPSQYIGRRPPFEIIPFANPAFRTIGIRRLRGLAPTPIAARVTDMLTATVREWLERENRFSGARAA